MLTDRLPNTLVLKYYLYSVTRSHGFVIPIIVEYFLTRGLSFTQVGTVEAIFMVGWVVGEIPTGYISDRIGRRNSLILSSGLGVLALIILGTGQSFLVFAFGNVIGGLGVTFRSGAGSAWLYDILSEQLDEDEYSRVKGRGWSTQQVTTAVTAILGSYLASLAWWYPFAASALLVGSGILVVATFPQSKQFTDGSDEEQLTIIDALPIIREKFTQPPLRSFVVYMALFFGFVSVALTFVQPISTNLGVPVAYLGWLYAGFSLVSAGAGYVADDAKKMIGLRRWLLVAPVALAGIFISVMVIPLAVLPAFFVLRGVRSITSTLRSQYINDRIESLGRATALSAASMVFALAAAAARFFGGIVADVTSPITMLGLFGALFVGGTIMLFVWESPVPATQPSAMEKSTD